MTVKALVQTTALILLLLALGSCGGGGGSTSARSGELTCVWDISTWDNGCIWG